MNINEILKEYNIESKFDFDSNELEVKIVGIFDKDFKLLERSISNQQSWLVLGQTCIYALSGGEEPDKGYILVGDKKIEILDCKKAPNGQHLHLINTDLVLEVNQSVKVCCDVEMKNVISANHTAEHLVQGTLQKLLSPDLVQKGVNLTHDSLSVSFEWKEKLSDQQLQQIEDYVNDAIAKAIPVEISYKTLEEARASGVRAKFDEVYSKVKGLLRIVKIGDIYNVLCAGRHAHNTSELEQFHILKLSSKGSNVWKIDAIATNYLINKYIDKFNKEILEKISDIRNQMSLSKYNNQEFVNKLDSIQLSNDWKQTKINQQLINKLSNEFVKLLDIFKNQQLNEMVNSIVETTIVDITKPYHFIQLDNAPSNILNTLGSKLIHKCPNTGFVIVNVLGNKLSYALIKDPNTNIIKPNELIKQINALVNGRGGGKDNQCQGSCPYTLECIDKIKNLLNSLQ